MGKNNVAIKNEQESSAIKIKSIQAASLYRVNNSYKIVLKSKNEDGSYSGIKEYREPLLDYGNAVISNSLFTKYVRKHGAVVNKYNKSLDFLMMKFDWGVDEDDSNKGNIKPAMTTQELMILILARRLKEKRRLLPIKCFCAHQEKQKKDTAFLSRKNCIEKCSTILQWGFGRGCQM